MCSSDLVDLPALEQAADRFFTWLDGLADDPAGGVSSGQFATWLAAGSVVTAAFELARRRLKKSSPDAALGGSLWVGRDGERLPGWPAVPPGEQP